MEAPLSKNKKAPEKGALKIVTRPGFEPRQSESESDVLPLYYRALQCKANN